MLFRWDKVQVNLRKLGYHYSRISGVLMSIGLMVACGLTAVGGYASYMEASPVHIDSIETAQKYVVGTWTYTDPLDPNNHYIWAWEKWVIKDGGAMDIYTAAPRDDSWGSPKPARYEIITDKYADTGERFYAIHVLDSVQTAIIRPDGELCYSLMGNGGVVMRRGDKKPFSK